MNDEYLKYLAESLYGCCAMDSVVLDIINSIAEDYNQPKFESYTEALELLQENQIECAECPNCGWISEGNFYEHPDHDDGVCSDCEVF